MIPRRFGRNLEIVSVRPELSPVNFAWNIELKNDCTSAKQQIRIRRILPERRPVAASARPFRRPHDSTHGGRRRITVPAQFGVLFRPRPRLRR